MGVIVFNGNSSSTYGIEVEHPPAYIYPKKDLEVIHVPGRNGDIIIDKGSYQNVTREYDIAAGSLSETYQTIANRVSSWLHSASGYARLEDSYEPDYFRLAYYDEENTFTNILGKAGRATIKFVCKPQRYLKSGETPLLYTAASIITNNTSFQSSPLIKVTGSGSGSVVIGSYTISIDNISGTTFIDCELQDCWNGVNNWNSHVTMPNGFPKLVPGSNAITIQNGVEKVEITPRWWTI